MAQIDIDEKIKLIIDRINESQTFSICGATSEEYKHFGEILDEFHDRDIAVLIQEISPEKRKKVYKIIGLDRTSEVFTYLDDPSMYLEELGSDKAADVIENMHVDDAVDVLENVDEENRQVLISKMDKEAVEDIKLIYSYDDNQIGNKMTTDFIVVDKGIPIKKAMKELIQQADENDNIATIYVKDENGKYYGAIELKDLIKAREYTDLEEIISRAYPCIYAKDNVSDVIEKLKDYSEDSIPVLDDNNKIIGAITTTDIVEATEKELSEDYAKLAGLTAENDLNESIGVSIKKRLPWLVLLLILGLIVSSVVGNFESVMASATIIVAFQSLILDMSGNVGTQSLAVTIRVLMDENIGPMEKAKLVWKEFRIGFIDGALLGVCASIFITFYLHFIKGNSLQISIIVSICVSMSLLVAVIVSSCLGTLVPMTFHKIKIDPAVASGPLITTLNDLVAVIIYYSLSGFLLFNIFKLL